MDKTENVKQAELRLQPLDTSPTECDGFVRLAQAVLLKHRIPFVIKQGTFNAPFGKIGLHFWIEIDGFIADYRARMWVGDQASHGLFIDREGYYQGDEVDMGVTDPLLFTIISGHRLADY